MNVFYDSIAIDSHPFAGVTLYYSELTRQISKKNTVQIGIAETSNVYFLEQGFAPAKRPWRDCFAGIPFKGKRRLCMFLSKYAGNRLGVSEQVNLRCSEDIARSGDFDIWHFTALAYHPILRKNTCSRPVVITVHDLTPEVFSWNPHQLELRRKLAIQADHIIAVSKKTKNDIVALWGIPPEKIDVIYHGCSLDESDTGCASQFGSYVLYVGGRSGYKNFMFFAKTMSLFLQKHPEVNIVCTGQPFSDEESELLHDLGTANRFVQKFVDNKDFFSLYKNASMFVYPSKYEGFGMPILDAFKAGCPVVLSRASCFPEIAEDAALYFESEDTQGFLSAVERLYSDPAFRDSLIQRAYQRLAFFSWEKAAEQTLAVYNKILGK